MKPFRILVIVVARIGDTLLITPTLRAIKERYPKAIVTVMAHPKRMEVLENLPCVDRLVPVTPKTAFWRYRFSGHCFDQAIVFGHDVSLIKLALRASREVVAFKQTGVAESSRLKQVPKPAQGMHAVQERLLLANALGIETRDYRLVYAATDAENKWGAAWLAKRVPSSASALIGIQPLSFPTKSHRDWPLSSFDALVVRLRQTYPKAHFLVFGDALARQKSEALARRHGAYMTTCAGELSLRQSAALMVHLNLYIGVDTGPTHLAGAIGVPMVAMYHCAYPGRYLMPLGHPALHVIEHPLTGKTRSPEESMDAISIDQVYAAAVELLNSRGKV